MTNFRPIISVLVLLIFSVWSVQAQSNCDFDVADIIARVSNECANIGENQVCYGNRNVNATPRIRTVDFNFDNPGDIADLTNIQSLVVDAFNINEDTWGVAQMRLQVGSNEGLRDVTMLLFGTFNLENAVPDHETLVLVAQSMRVNIYAEPFLAAEIIESVASGDLLTAVGRLENDDSWLRVENPSTGTVGWVERQNVAVRDGEVLEIEDLGIQDPSTPYFSAMQAFYFTNGNSDLGCDSLQTDGIIIQTPEGTARISLLINEVSIELVGGQDANGNPESGTAIIQANPQSEQGMSVNVVQGQVTVETDQGTQTVQSGQRSSIPISVNVNGIGFSPSGAPQEPVEVDYSDVDIDSVLSALSPADNSTGDNNGSSSTVNVTTGSGSSNNNSNNNNSGDGSGVGGFDITIGNGSDDSSSSSGSSDSNSSGNNNNSDSSNPITGTGTTTINPFIPGDQIFQGFGEQGNIIALSIALIAGIILLAFIIWYTIRRNK